MGMDSTYQNWHKRIDTLHFRVKDATDQPDHPASRALHDQIRYLMDECELQKKPHNLEERIKQIMQTLEPARNGSQQFMSVGDAVRFHDDFEDLRREVRSHPDYS